MSSFQELLNLLQICLNPSRELITIATAKIKEYSENSFQFFVTAMINGIIINSQIEQNIRVLACATMTNMFKNQETISKWFGLPHEQREEMKNNLLNVLGCKDYQIQRLVGFLVAKIAKYELEQNLWPNFFKILKNGSIDKDLNNKKVSYLILKELLSEFPKTSPVIQSNKDNIMDIIFAKENDPVTLKQDPGLFENYLRAINGIIPFISSNFALQEFRTNFIQILISYCSDSNDVYIQVCFEIFLSICVLYYDYLGDGFHQIAKFSLSLMINPSDKISNIAITFLIEFCQIEEKKKENQTHFKNYLEPFYPSLFQIISSILLERPKNTNETITPYSSCSYLLDSMSRLFDSALVKDVFKLIAININSESERNKSAALFAFYSILETSANQLIVNVLNDCINMMINLMNDNSLEIRENVSICIEKISEHHGGYVTEKFKNFSELFNSIFNQINLRPINPKILVHYLRTLHYLTNSINVDKITSLNSIYENKLNDIFNSILQICYIPEAYNLDYNAASEGFLVLGTLIEHSTSQELNIINSYVQGVNQALVHSLDINNFNNNRNKMYDFQMYQINLIIAFGNYGLIQLTEEQGMSFYSLLFMIIKNREGLFEEIVLAIPSLLSIMTNGKDKVLQNFLDTYFFTGLEAFNQVRLCRYSMMALSEFFELKIPVFLNYIPKIMEQLKKIVISPQYDQILKAQVLNVYTDMFSNFQNEYIDYYSETFEMAINALKASIERSKISNIQDEVDEDEEEYIDILNGYLLEYLGCIIRISQELGKQNEIEQYIPLIMDFIHMISLDKKLNFDTALNCGAIISDLCSIYKSKMNSYILEDPLKKIMDKLKNQFDRGRQLYDFLLHVAMAIKMNLKFNQ